MLSRRVRRNRRKLAAAAAVLALVFAIAVIAQRRPSSADPFVVPDEQMRSRTRPVFGEAAPSAERARAAEPAAPTNTVPGGIEDFLERWRSTLASRDADAHAALYAPRVDRFFRKRGVTRAAVQKEKSRLLAQYPRFEKYEIRDVRVESRAGNRAVVTFTKDWDIRGKRRFAGSERQRLTLRHAGDRWEITGEEELKVFWMKRG